MGANQLIEQCQQSCHPTFRGTSALNRGTLQRKSGRNIIHFTADAGHIQSIMRTIHSTNQLSINGAVSIWCESIQKKMIRYQNCSIRKKLVSGGRLPPVRSCRRGGCSVPPHTQCRVGYCVDHCTSARCTRNRRPTVRPPPHQQTPTPQHPTTRNRASRVDAVHNPSPQGAAAPGPSASGRPPLVARAPPVGSPPAPPPPPNPPPVPRPCRRRGCLEPVHFECSTGFCNLHCGSRRCSFHNYSSGNGRGAALWSSTP